jgi:hypothetical protein
MMPPNSMSQNNMMGQQGQQAQTPQVPQLPPSLAMQILARAAMRMNPQMNPMMGIGGMAQPQQQMGAQPPQQMPGMQPTPVPQPSTFWGQPSDMMKQNALAQSSQQDASVGAPGQLQGVSTPKIPDNMQGMGLGATAPQIFNGGQGIGQSGIGQPNDPTSDLRSQLFKAYLNQYPQGNL